MALIKARRASGWPSLASDNGLCRLRQQTRRTFPSYTTERVLNVLIAKAQASIEALRTLISKADAILTRGAVIRRAGRRAYPGLGWHGMRLRREHDARFCVYVGARCHRPRTLGVWGSSNPRDGD